MFYMLAEQLEWRCTARSQVFIFPFQILFFYSIFFSLGLIFLLIKKSQDRQLFENNLKVYTLRIIWICVIARRNISNLRYADYTTLMAESKEELKSLLMKVKEEIKKVG